MGEVMELGSGSRGQWRQGCAVEKPLRFLGGVHLKCCLPEALREKSVMWPLKLDIDYTILEMFVFNSNSSSMKSQSSRFMCPQCTMYI